MHDELWVYLFSLPYDIVCWKVNDPKEMWSLYHVVSLHNGEAPMAYAELDRLLFEGYEAHIEARKRMKSLEEWKMISNGTRNLR